MLHGFPCWLYITNPLDEHLPLSSHLLLSTNLLYFPQLAIVREDRRWSIVVRRLRRKRIICC